MNITYKTKKVKDGIEVTETTDLQLASGDNSIPNEHVTTHIFDSKESLANYQDLLSVEYSLQIKELETKLLEVNANLENLKSLK